MTISQAEAAAAAAPLRVEPNGPAEGGLTEWEAMDPAALASGTPVQRGHLYDEDEGLGYSVGVWDCTAFDDRPGPYPVDEYMLLLEGKVIMEMPDGTEITIEAGEAFIIPKGLTCQWKMPGYVRKVFMILDRPDGAEAANPSLNRVSKPPMGALGGAGEQTVVVSHTAFLNADGRMAVTRHDYPQAVTGAQPATVNRLVTVLAGGIELDGTAFRPGDTVYLQMGQTHRWRITEGTRLIEAIFNPGR
ncbi:MAG: cupin domain-containing protein [Pikeienuella sp.]